MALLAKIRGLNHQIAAVESDIGQVSDELSVLRHIDDDAQRDAAVTDKYDDRAAAKMTHSDVIRISKQIEAMERTRAKLVAKRDRMIRRLAAE